jgi:hypothetical protein
MNASCCLIVVGLLAYGVSAQAQKPQVTLSVQQKVESESDNNATRRTQTKEKDRTCELTMLLRNGDPKEQKVKVAWYFIGDPLQSGLDKYVYDKGELDVTVPARSSTNLVQKSKPIGSKIAVSQHKTTKSGAKHLGYIVTLAQDTNRLAMVAAPMSLDRASRDPKVMAELLAAPAPLAP